MERRGADVETRFFTYEGAGRLCSCSRWTLYRAAKSGHLTRYGSAARPRFLREELDDWMTRGAPTTAAEVEGVPAASTSPTPRRTGGEA